MTTSRRHPQTRMLSRPPRRPVVKPRKQTKTRPVNSRRRGPTPPAQTRTTRPASQRPDRSGPARAAAKNAAAAAMRDLAQDHGATAPSPQESRNSRPSWNPPAHGWPRPASDDQAKMSQHVSARAARSGPRAGKDAGRRRRRRRWRSQERRIRSRQGIRRAGPAANLAQPGRSQADHSPRTTRNAQAKLSRDLGELPQLARHEISRQRTGRYLQRHRYGEADHHRTTGTAERAQAAQRNRDRRTEQLATARRQRDQRRHREVTSPLHALVTHLERWHDVIDQAAGALTGNQLAASMPASLGHHHRTGPGLRPSASHGGGDSTGQHIQRSHHRRQRGQRPAAETRRRSRRVAGRAARISRHRPSRRRRTARPCIPRPGHSRPRQAPATPQAGTGLAKKPQRNR